MKPPRWRSCALHSQPTGCLRKPLSNRSFGIRPPLLRSSSSAFSTAPTESSNPKAADDALPARWMSDLKTRLGRCIQFGLSREQAHEAGLVLGVLARDWRELVAGSEGFLTGPERRGLFRREVVWGEMDAMGHVNNVMYVRYSESGRVRWFQNFALYLDPANRRRWEELWTPRGHGLILKSIKIDYKFPMGFPDKITVLHRLRSAPDPRQDSFFLDVVVLSERHQRPAARAEEDVLVYDYTKGKKAPLPPYMAAQFEQTFALQEEAKRANRARVRELTLRVRRLEEESWDRADAKEDLGSASGGTRGS